MTKLAAIILTKNEEQHIGECLDSLAWVEQRVVFDSFSTDRTCEIAREHGAEELSPYFCLGDYPLSDAFGWGLVRTMTIAEAGQMCDFRLKRGRKVERKLSFDGAWH